MSLQTNENVNLSGNINLTKPADGATPAMDVTVAQVNAFISTTQGNVQFNFTPQIPDLIKLNPQLVQEQIDQFKQIVNDKFSILGLGITL